jgi:hypothetical protein
VNIQTDDPIWLVNYTIFHGSKIEAGHEPVEILSHQSYEEDIVAFRRIPDCYFRKLVDHTNIASIYTHSGLLSSNKAIDWLLNDASGNTECEDENFIERYALVTMIFVMNGTTDFISQRKQCTWPAITCSGGQVDTITAENWGLKSDTDIPSEINLLQSLKNLQLCECCDNPDMIRFAQLSKEMIVASLKELQNESLTTACMLRRQISLSSLLTNPSTALPHARLVST